MADLTKLEAPYLNTVIVASRRYIKENPQQMEAFLKGTIDGLYFLPNPANEKVVKSVLARRMKLSTPQSIQIMYDATVDIHAKTKLPYATLAGVQNMIDALIRMTESALTRMSLAGDRDGAWQPMQIFLLVFGPTLLESALQRRVPDLFEQGSAQVRLRSNVRLLQSGFASAPRAPTLTAVPIERPLRVGAHA